MSRTSLLSYSSLLNRGHKKVLACVIPALPGKHEETRSNTLILSHLSGPRTSVGGGLKLWLVLETHFSKREEITQRTLGKTEGLGLSIFLPFCEISIRRGGAQESAMARGLTAAVLAPKSRTGNGKGNVPLPVVCQGGDRVLVADKEFAHIRSVILLGVGKKGQKKDDRN